MVNLLDTVLGFLPSNLEKKAQDITRTAKSTAKKPDDHISKNVNKLKSSSIMFQKESAKPDPSNEITKALIKKYGILKFAQGALKLKDKRKSILAPLGSPIKSEIPSEKKKQEGLELLRSGKAEKEIDEIKKEWLIEESNARTIFGNPDLTYEQARNLPIFKKNFEDAERKWDIKWEKNRDQLVPSLIEASKQSLVEQVSHKQEWIKKKLPNVARDIP